MSTVQTFDDDSMGRIAEQVARLERMYWNLQQELRALGLKHRHGRGKKRLVRFTLDGALTTADSDQLATVTDQFGPGRLHNVANAITALNLETSTGGVYQWSGASGDAGLAYWHEDDTYQIVWMEIGGSSPSTMHAIRATLSADMCSTDASGSIDNVEFLGGFTGSAPASALNVLKLAGANNDIVFAVRRPSSGNWEIWNIQHVQNQYLEKMIEPSEITAGQIPTLDAGQAPADPGCDYRFRRLATPMVKEPIGGASCVQEAHDEINFAPFAVLTDLTYGNDASGNPCIDGKVKVVWIPDQCDEVPDEWVNVICGVKCPTGTP